MYGNQACFKWSTGLQAQDEVTNSKYSLYPPDATHPSDATPAIQGSQAPERRPALMTVEADCKPQCKDKGTSPFLCGMKVSL